MVNVAKIKSSKEKIVETALTDLLKMYNRYKDHEVRQVVLNAGMVLEQILVREEAIKRGGG